MLIRVSFPAVIKKEPLKLLGFLAALLTVWAGIGAAAFSALERPAW